MRSNHENCHPSIRSKLLPIYPLDRGGVKRHGTCGFTPPPNPLPQGEGEDFLLPRGVWMRQGERPGRAQALPLSHPCKPA